MSLNHLEAVPASPAVMKDLLMCGPLSAWQQWAERGGGLGTGDTDGPEGSKQEAAVLPPPLLLLFLS